MGNVVTCLLNFSNVQNMIIIELLRQYTREKDAEILYLIRKGCFNEVLCTLL